MSLLNKLKQIRKEFPNDLEFGSEVNKLIIASRTCCDLPENLFKEMKLDTYPYGWNVEEINCKVCGKMVDCNVEK